MQALPDDRCPRCGREFHCGMHDQAPCACTTLTLGVELQQRLRETFDGCLCLDCLAACAAGEALRPPASIADPDERVGPLHRVEGQDGASR